MRARTNISRERNKTLRLSHAIPSIGYWGRLSARTLSRKASLSTPAKLQHCLNLPSPFALPQGILGAPVRCDGYAVAW
jgi:hypothetical protein